MVVRAHDAGHCEKAGVCCVSGWQEISGDAKMPPLQRIEYLWRNVKRNLGFAGSGLTAEHFVAGKADAKGCPSPGRLLTELHLRRFLPSVLPVGKVRVLDIGCGSGRLCQILADMGYSGEYVGLDIGDRFGVDGVPGFDRSLVLGDAHNYDPIDSRFDLIASLSALEHIPAERSLIDRLPDMLLPGGIELHYVPSGWGLLVYLWHGYRQYPLHNVPETFGHRDVRTFALGGLSSFLLHFFLITVSEMLLKIPVRKTVPGLYTWLLGTALMLDRYVRLCPTMFAIFRLRQRPE